LKDFLFNHNRLHNINNVANRAPPTCTIDAVDLDGVVVPTGGGVVAPPPPPGILSVPTHLYDIEAVQEPCAPPASEPMFPWFTIPQTLSEYKTVVTPLALLQLYRTERV
jgi:hypothetical protein